MKNPTISVIMPAYNAQEYIKEAIESILNQTYSDFEFIIINDGSTDKTEDIILSFNDPRIKYIKNSHNLGIVKSLNRAIDLAKGDYIARMDADDISLPHRLERQHTYMNSNPNVDICGSYMIGFGDRESIIKYPLTHQEIIVRFLFNNSMAHPTIFAKSRFYQEMKYEEIYKDAEDYALWVKACQKFKFANIDEVLLKYRMHEKQISFSKYQQQQEKVKYIKKIILSYLGGGFNNEDIKVLDSIREEKYISMTKISACYTKIIEQNRLSNIFNQDTLVKELSIRLIWMLNSNSHMGIRLIILYFSSPLRYKLNISFLIFFKIFIKSIIRYKNL